MLCKPFWLYLQSSQIVYIGYDEIFSMLAVLQKDIKHQMLKTGVLLPAGLAGLHLKALKTGGKKFSGLTMTSFCLFFFSRTMKNNVQIF